MSEVPSTILLAGATEAFDLLSTFFNQWAIYATGTSTSVIEPDTFISIEFRGEANVSTYPVEQGAFADYNKVQRPLEMRLRIACSPAFFYEKMSRHDFLGQLDEMKNSTDLYDIATPDAYYKSFTLIHYDYARRAENGVSMIVADCWFMEVRQVMTTAYSTAQTPAGLNGLQSNSPSANDPVDVGTVSAQPSTAGQSASLSTAGGFL